MAVEPSGFSSFRSVGVGAASSQAPAPPTSWSSRLFHCPLAGFSAPNVDRIEYPLIDMAPAVGFEIETAPEVRLTLRFSCAKADRVATKKTSSARTPDDRVGTRG